MTKAHSGGRQSSARAQIRWLAVCCLAVALHSCVHAPRDTYLQRGAAAKFARVALRVSSAPVRVRYYGESSSHAALYVLEGSTLFLPLLAVAPAVYTAETAIRSSKDEGLASGLREMTTQSYVEALLTRHFVEPFNDLPTMHVETYGNGAELPSSDELLAEGYDAAIELDIGDLSLVKVFTDALAVHAEVVGKMVDLKKDEVVWKRQVAATSTDPHSLDSYHAGNGLLLRNTVDRLFDMLAVKLSNDIIYSR